MIPIDTIVVPQGAEYQAVCRGLKKANAHQIRVVPIPIGINNIQQTFANYSIELGNAQNILITGLCGSLSKRYVGDTILYKNCFNLDRQRVNLQSELTTAIQQKLSVGLVSGLTSDRVINRAKEKLELSQTYGVSVVDMEGYQYIQELQQRNKTVAMVRVVSDDLAGNIPDLTTAIDRDGNLRIIPTAIALVKQPIGAIRLIKGSLTGLKALQKTIQQLFEY